MQCQVSVDFFLTNKNKGALEKEKEKNSIKVKLRQSGFKRSFCALKTLFELKNNMTGLVS
jgi:hypothetical protein